MAKILRLGVAKAICICGFEVRFGEPPLQRTRSDGQAFKPGRRGDRSPENKMPDVDSYDSSSGIAVDVQQRLNCALP